MSFWEWIADRTILAPSTKPIDAGSAQRISLSCDNVPFELWRINAGPTTSAAVTPPELIILKFPGAGGRAERMGVHPFELLGLASATIYGANPPGYGQTGGRARVRHLPAMARSCWDYVALQHPGCNVLVTGNSLGCVAALLVASQFPVSGLLLRHPPPIHQLIRQRRRYNLWNFGAGKFVARAVPDELDAIVNAARCRCPALFISSENDRVVPQLYQRQIFEQYRGEKQLLVLSGAGHHDRVPESQTDAYVKAVRWLWKTCQ